MPEIHHFDQMVFAAYHLANSLDGDTAAGLKLGSCYQAKRVKPLLLFQTSGVDPAIGAMRQEQIVDNYEDCG